MHAWAKLPAKLSPTVTDLIGKRVMLRHLPHIAGTVVGSFDVPCPETPLCSTHSKTLYKVKWDEPAGMAGGIPLDELVILETETNQ